MVSSGHGSALIGFRPRFVGFQFGLGVQDWGCDMYSMRCASTSYAAIKAVRIGALLVSATAVRNVNRLFAVALAGALLGACAQSSVVTRNAEFTASRQASLQHNRAASFVTNRRIVSAKKHTPFASHKNAVETQIASQGVASFYTEGTETASGEKFDTHDLTAAHPTLPFGTKLRVTNVATGRSVTVRVNDRGPFVPGRNVDVSYSAADALGMVGAGLAKVRMEVVQ
jgi:rare lipoprotein A